MKLIYSLLALVLFSVSSCKKCEECCKPTQEYDPSNPSSYSSCKAPEVGKNIIGSWKFESHKMDSLGRVRTGYVTFDALGRMYDPDSLVDNRINFVTGNPIDGYNDFDRPVSSKECTITDKRVEIKLYYIHPRLGKTHGLGWIFEVVENQCNRIRMVHPTDKDLYVILTR